jgi:hypothetical protein
LLDAGQVDLSAEPLGELDSFDCTEQGLLKT